LIFCSVEFLSWVYPEKVKGCRKLSGILLKNAPVGNIFAIHVTFIDKTDESFYFYANGFVGAQDSL
ncbi:hypothetical protein, partial [Klebsiella aerogenes]|uniref:hypothetical protein n=1 Tax=Klebsiella aerogenes TaxID=548 RepID=UPI001FB14554